MKNFIMLLTYLRIFFGPLIFIIAVFFEMYFASLVIFIMCSFSDFLDGYLARKFNKESSLGKLLDPIADKILLCSTILSIILITNDYFIGLMGTLILIREYWVSGLREYTAVNNIQGASDVSYLAKIKTTLQFIAIGSYLFSFSYGLSLGIFISSFILFLSLLVSLKTGMTYTENVLKSK
jgi:CDP-diacylglycerol--glycerol-3-phosphate 3-phosphatidyltransferase